MTRIYQSSAALCVLGALAITGCKHADAPPPANAGPTTMAMPETNMKMPGPTTMAVPSAEPKPAMPTASTTVPVPETNMKTAGPTTMAVPAAAPAPATPPPAATPEPAPAPAPPPAAVTPPPPPSAAIPAAKDLTHFVSADTPYYLTEPGATPGAPAGTLKAGAKLLVIIPGAMYTQVITDAGVSAYVPTAELKALPK